MLLDSQETKPENSVNHTKVSRVDHHVFIPKQIQAGAKVVMTYQERLNYLRSSKLGEVYGFSQTSK